MNSKRFPRPWQVSFFSVFLAVGAWLGMAVPAVATPMDDLKSEEPVVRKQAVQRLGGKEAVPALVAALDDEEASVRAAAVRSLGRLRDSDAVEGLIGVLGDDDHNVRFYAAGALGEIKEPDAASALIAALGDKEWLVRDQAAWALREIRAESSLPDLIATLRGGGDLERIAWILKGFGDAVVHAHLKKFFQGEKPEDRLLGVRVLKEYGPSEALGGLLAGAVEDLDPKVRIAAISALRERKMESLKEILRERLARETDPAVRELIDSALADMAEQLMLVAHWSFDDRNETVAKDVTGGGSDGEMKGGMPVDGKIGAALRFGGGHHVLLGKPVNLPIGGKPFTIAAWVKTDAGDGVVVARGGAACGFSLHIAGGKPGFGIRRSEDEGPLVAVAEESISGDWTHLAGTVENDRVSLFVNGKLAASTKTTGLMPGNCGQGMEIGIDLQNSPVEVEAAFEGIIDEVRMYHSALNEEDLVDVIAADEKR